MKKTKIAFSMMIGTLLISAPISFAASFVSKNDSGIVIDGNSFINLQSARKYLDEKYGIKNIQNIQDNYYIEQDGKRIYLGKTQLNQITNNAIENSHVETIYSTYADIEQNLVNPAIGELSPKWFNDTQIEPGTAINIWKGNNDTVYTDEASALDSYFTGTHEIFYFNNIFFKSKNDLRIYLLNHYFNDEQNKNVSSFRIQAPNGEYSNMINMSSKSDWKSQAISFIEQNCKRVFKIKTATGYRYFSADSKEAIDKAITFEDVPYIKVKANDGQMNFVIGLNESDSYDLSGSLFYTGYTDIAQAMTSPDKWTRITDGYTKSITNEQIDKFNSAINAFFDSYVDKGEKSNDSKGNIVYSSTHLFQAIGDSGNTFTDGLASNYKLLNLKMNNSPDLKTFDSYYYDVETDTVESEEIITFDSAFTKTAEVVSLGSLSLLYKNYIDGSFPQYSYVYTKALEVSNNFSSMKSFNHLLKIPLLFCYMMDKFISDGAPNELIKATRLYFQNVCDIYTNLIIIGLGETALKPSNGLESHGELNLVELFGINSTEIEFDINKYLTYIVNTYPSLITGSKSLVDAAFRVEYGFELTNATIEDLASQACNSFFSNSPNDMVMGSVYQNTLYSIYHYLNRARNVLADEEIIDQVQKSDTMYSAFSMFVNRLNNTANRDLLLENIEYYAQELLNSPDSWEYVPNDNAFKKFAYFTREVESKYYTPNDILLTINALDSNSLLEWFKTLSYVDDVMESEEYTDIAKHYLEYYPDKNIEHTNDNYAEQEFEFINAYLNRKTDYLFNNSSYRNFDSIFSGVYMTFEEFSSITIMRMLGDLAQKETLFIMDNELGAVVINPEFKTSATKLLIDISKNNSQLMVQLTHLYRGFQSIQQKINELAEMYKYKEGFSWSFDYKGIQMILRNTAQYAAIINQNIDYLQQQLASINVPLKQGQIIAYSGTTTELYNKELEARVYDLNVKTEYSAFESNSEIVDFHMSFLPKVNKSKSSYVIPDVEVVNNKIESLSITPNIYLYPTKLLKGFEGINRIEYCFDKYLDVNFLNELNINRYVKTNQLVYDAKNKFYNSIFSNADFNENYVYVKKWGYIYPIINGKTINPNKKPESLSFEMPELTFGFIEKSSFTTNNESNDIQNLKSYTYQSNNKIENQSNLYSNKQQRVSEDSSIEIALSSGRKPVFTQETLVGNRVYIGLSITDHANRNVYIEFDRHGNFKGIWSGFISSDSQVLKLALDEYYDDAVLLRTTNKLTGETDSIIQMDYDSLNSKLTISKITKDDILASDNPNRQLDDIFLEYERKILDTSSDNPFERGKKLDITSDFPNSSTFVVDQNTSTKAFEDFVSNDNNSFFGDKNLFVENNTGTFDVYDRFETAEDPSIVSRHDANRQTSWSDSELEYSERKNHKKNIRLGDSVDLIESSSDISEYVDSFDANKELRKSKRLKSESISNHANTNVLNSFADDYSSTIRIQNDYALDVDDVLSNADNLSLNDDYKFTPWHERKDKLQNYLSNDAKIIDGNWKQYSSLDDLGEDFINGNVSKKQMLDIQDFVNSLSDDHSNDLKIFNDELSTDFWSDPSGESKNARETTFNQLKERIETLDADKKLKTMDFLKTETIDKNKGEFKYNYDTFGNFDEPNNFKTYLGIESVNTKQCDWPVAKGNINYVGTNIDNENLKMSVADSNTRTSILEANDLDKRRNVVDFGMQKDFSQSNHIIRDNIDKSIQFSQAGDIEYARFNASNAIAEATTSFYGVNGTDVLANANDVSSQALSSLQGQVNNQNDISKKTYVNRSVSMSTIDDKNYSVGSKLTRAAVGTTNIDVNTSRPGSPGTGGGNNNNGNKPSTPDISDSNKNIKNPLKKKKSFNFFKFVEKAGYVVGPIGFIWGAFELASLIITWVNAGKHRPCAYEFKADNYEWQWSGGIIKDPFSLIPIGGTGPIDIQTASAMKLNTPIKINNSYVRDSYYYGGKLYDVSEKSKQDILDEYKKNLYYGYEPSNFVYSFDNNIGDRIISSDFEIDEKLGLFKTSTSLAKGVINDIDIYKEDSKYISINVKNFSDGFGGDWSSISSDAAITNATNEILAKIRPTIIVNRPIFDSDGLLEQSRTLTLLPGSSYDSETDKITTEEQKRNINPNFNTNNWFIINDSANELNQVNTFVEPNYTLSVTTARDDLINSFYNSIENSLSVLKTYNTKSLDLYSNTFTQVSKLISSSIIPVDVLVYNESGELKYFVDTHFYSRNASSKYQNLLTYIKNQYNIKTEIVTKESVSYWKVNNNYFETIDEILNYFGY